ncbi:DUF2867 domain-containing protein [Alteromonadales bacterium alter-6D02]|nr:DUF2867 domain-containing protein [Alteromonadales bacterium alter-6D02]
MCDVPTDSLLSTTLSNASFFDSYQFKSQFNHLSALDIWLAHAAATPWWVDSLMTLRNQVVSFFGLKNLGQISAITTTKTAQEYQVGDRVGIFSLHALSDNEVILADTDNHLGVKVSVLKSSEEHGQVTISTVVHVHNRLGRIYMMLVKPIHRVIVPASIRRAEFY